VVEGFFLAIQCVKVQQIAPLLLMGCNLDRVDAPRWYRPSVSASGERILCALCALFRRYSCARAMACCTLPQSVAYWSAGAYDGGGRRTILRGCVLWLWEKRMRDPCF